MNRFIPFDAIENARELGGLPTAGGRSVRRGLLLRTGNLSRATDADVERLQRDFRLTEVVDFRFSQGRVGDEQPTNEQFAATLVHYATVPRAQELARQLYPTILTDPRSQQYYGRFLRIVLEAEGGVLWHCSQGKDRAGLAAAFLLTALGADRETIVADFDLSNEGFATPLAMLSQKVRDMGGDRDALDFIQAMVGVSKKNFVRSLELIDAQYGSLEAYVTGQLGFSPADQDRLREKYLG